MHAAAGVTPMKRVRLSDKLLAVVMLATGIFALRSVYLTLSDKGVAERFASGSVSHPWDDPVLSVVRLAVFLSAGIACALGAWWLWTGRSTDRTEREPSREAPSFGRGARPHAVRRPALRLLLYAVPVIAILALVGDHFGPWRTPPQDSGVEQQLASEETAPEAAPNELAAAPDPDPATTSPEKAATPLQQAEQDGADDAGKTVAETTDAAGEEASWPQFVPAPGLSSPPQITAPPAPAQTTAPLPQPAPQPTQADGHHDAVVWLAVAPDGRSILSASTDHTIKLWDIDGKRLIRNVGQHKDMARSALFLPDGERALTAGDDGEIVLRSLADGAVLHVFSAVQHGGANKLALAQDGRRAVSVHEAGTAIVWDIENRSVLHILPGHDWPVVSVAMSPDGSRAISGSIDGTLKLWDTNAGRLIRSWRGHERGTYGAAFTSDGRQVLTGSGDYTIKLWDVETGREVRRFDGHSGTVYAVVISDDGERVLSGSLDGTARLWDMATGHEIAQFSGHAGPVYAVAFAADGAILTGGNDRTIRIWPAGGGEAVALFPGAPD